MSEDFSKLMELMKTDEGFKTRLQEKAEGYTGDKSGESVFNGIIVPVAAEYGLDVSCADAKAWAENLKCRALDPDELSQVSGGGEGKGYGMVLCDGLGIGLGAAAGDDDHGWFYAGLCLLAGVGQGELDCWGSGTAK